MADPVVDAAHEWLSRFVGMYQGMDAGEGDPVHDVRVLAEERLAAGPTASDPFTICGLMIDALADDARATTLAETWCRDYLAALKSL